MRPQIRSFLLASLVLVGCERENAAKPPGDLPAPATAAPATTQSTAAEPPQGPAADDTLRLTRVSDVSQVCMVNNQFMGRAQIPVAVGGKTYFGCCEMCKGRLVNDAKSRIAKDPVTGKEVDKSTAVIAKRDDGHVLYFENTENLERYQAGAI